MLGTFVFCLIDNQKSHKKGWSMSKKMPLMLRREGEGFWFSCCNSILKIRVGNLFCCHNTPVIVQDRGVSGMTFLYSNIRVYNSYVLLIPNKRGHRHHYMPTNMRVVPANTFSSQKSPLRSFPDYTSHDQINRASKSCTDIAIIWKYPSGGTYWLSLWVDYMRDLS